MPRLLPILVLMACGPSTGSTGPGDTDPGPAGPKPELTEARLEAHTRALTDLGPRLSATPAEAEAERVVMQALKAGGLEPELAPFVWDAWRPGTATLAIGDQRWDVEAHSPSPDSVLTAPLVAEGGPMDGAIGLYSSNTGSRAEHFLRAVTTGAAAFIRITDFVGHDGEALVEVGHTLEGSTMPGAAVDTFVGDELRALTGEQATLAIDSDIAYGHTSNNVVARVGPANSGRQVFVLAHYDSWHTSESAFDNALGVGALIAMAERLAAGPEPEIEVVFIATTGEEQGLQGAFAWVEQHADEVGPGDVAITLDVMWAGEGTYSCMASTDGLRAQVMAAAEAEGLSPRDAGVPTPASDHFPFNVEGADAIWCGRWSDRHYHTDADTLDELNLKKGAQAMRANWAVVADLAGVPR